MREICSRGAELAVQSQQRRWDDATRHSQLQPALSSAATDRWVLSWHSFSQSAAQMKKTHMHKITAGNQHKEQILASRRSGISRFRASLADCAAAAAVRCIYDFIHQLFKSTSHRVDYFPPVSAEHDLHHNTSLIRLFVFRTTNLPCENCSATSGTRARRVTMSRMWTGSHLQ